MVRKIKLDLESLAVESFVVDATATEYGTKVRGGVGGHLDDNATGLACSDGCTVQAQITCAADCYTWALTCQEGVGGLTNSPTYPTGVPCIPKPAASVECSVGYGCPYGSYVDPSCFYPCSG